MEVRLSLTVSEVLRAYQLAGAATGSGTGGVAFAPEFSEVQTWFENIWSEVQEAIQDVAQFGEARITDWTTRLKEKLKAAREALGDRASALVERLQAALMKAVRQVQSALLDLLPPSLLVEKVAVPLKELSVQYQLSIGGDLSASLNWALKMAAGTSITVAAKYSRS